MADREYGFRGFWKTFKEMRYFNDPLIQLGANKTQNF